MEIDGRNPLAGLSANVQRLEAQQQQNQARAPKSGAEGGPAGSDRIELSVRSREIQHLDDLIRSTPEIREAVVQEVRGAIERGTYDVKAERIAEKLINGSLIDQIF